MDRMFYGAKAFNQDISGWDVRGVKNMDSMFWGAEAYNNGDAALDWGDNTGLVESMSSMFREAKGFNQDISGWDVRGVKYMSGMFSGAEAYNNGGESLNVDDNAGAHSSWDFEARAGETPSTKPDVTNMFTNSPMDAPANANLRPKGL